MKCEKKQDMLYVVMSDDVNSINKCDYVNHLSSQPLVSTLLLHLDIKI